MLVVNIFTVLFLIKCISAIDEKTPEIPSKFLENSITLPERSESVKINPSFQEYIPVACFCDQDKCEASVDSVESPIIGYFTREGTFVKSVEITVRKGELMFIVLLNRSSSLADDTYLERTSYWSLVDVQRQTLPGAPLDFSILQEISVSLMKKDSIQFSFTNDAKSTMIQALAKSTGLNISTSDESKITSNYRYAPSPLSDIVGIYQLIHELSVHPGVALTNYIGSKKDIARCKSFILATVSCGSLQLLPSFIQRTAVLNAVILAVPTTTTTTTTTIATTPTTRVDSTAVISETTTVGIDPKAKKSGGSGKAKAVIISLSVIAVVATVLSAAVWYHRRRARSYSSVLSVQADIIRPY